MKQDGAALPELDQSASSEKAGTAEENIKRRKTMMEMTMAAIPNQNERLPSVSSVLFSLAFLRAVAPITRAAIPPRVDTGQQQRAKRHDSTATATPMVVNASLR